MSPREDSVEVRPHILDAVRACAPVRKRSVDHEALAEALSALAYASRLELLEILAHPKAASDVRLVARRRTEWGEHEVRPASRQTIAKHVAKLVAADLVRETAGVDGDRARVRYATNTARLFDLVEDLRRVSMRVMNPAVDVDETIHSEGVESRLDATGPRFVLVRGAYEDHVYRLSGTNTEDGRWTIGRRKGLAIRLDYDRYVSSEHAHVEAERGGYRLRGREGNRNGTFVNGVRIPDGESRSLRPGDLVAVGRSLLVFADS